MDKWMSASSGGACVEVQRDGDVIKIRDSKDREGPRLTYTIPEWEVFIEGVKAGKFDLV